MLSHSRNPSIRLAQLLLGWFCVLLYAFVGVYNLPAYADSKALAVGTALSEAGVSAARLDAVLDAVFAVDDLRSGEGDDKEAVSSIYRAVSWFAELDSDSTASVGIAWQYPRDAFKSPLSVVRYASLRDKIRRLTHRVGGTTIKATLSPDEWRSSAVSLRRLAQNAAGLSQEEFSRFIFAVRKIATATDVFQEVSLLEMRRVWEGLYALTAEVNVSGLYAMDFLVEDGFCTAVGADLAYVVRAFRSLSYERVIEAMLQLPDKARAAYALVQYVFAEQRTDMTVLCRLLYALEVYGLIPRTFSVNDFRDEVSFLATCPNAPTEDEWQQLTPHVQALLALFTQ